MANQSNPGESSPNNSNYSQDDIQLQGKKGGRLKDKRFSVQEELLPVFWLSGSAALGRDDGFEQLTFSPWRRGAERVDGLPFPAPRPQVAGAGGRRYSRQLEIVPSEQRRKSDAARRSASSGAAAVSVAALAAMTAGDAKGGKKVPEKENSRLLAPPKNSSIYEDAFLGELEGDSLLFQQLAATSDGGRRESRQCPRASQCSVPPGRDPRVARRNKIVSVFIIVVVGLVVLSLLLVTITLRLAPEDEDAVRQQHEDFARQQLQRNTNHSHAVTNSTGAEFTSTINSTLVEQ